jgi:AICAR transformylase/IMP cyclohydrolase PurH
MVAHHLVLTGVKPKIGPAIVARETVFSVGVGHINRFHSLKIAVKRLQRHNAQRIIAQFYVPPDVKSRMGNRQNSNCGKSDHAPGGGGGITVNNCANSAISSAAIQPS